MCPGLDHDIEQISLAKCISRLKIIFQWIDYSELVMCRTPTPEETENFEQVRGAIQRLEYRLNSEIIEFFTFLKHTSFHSRSDLFHSKI